MLNVLFSALTTSTSDEVRVESLKALKGLGVHTTEKGLTALFNGLLAQITGQSRFPNKCFLLGDEKHDLCVGCKSPEQKAALLETVEGIESKEGVKEEEMDKVIVDTITSLFKTTGESTLPLPLSF